MACWYDNVPAPTDANGCVVPLGTTQLVRKGETLKVYGFYYSAMLKVWFVNLEEYGYTLLGACTIPDSWEKLEEDAAKAPREYVEERGITAELGGRVATMTSDILRRAKALAGVVE